MSPHLSWRLGHTSTSHTFLKGQKMKVVESYPFKIPLWWTSVDIVFLKVWLLIVSPTKQIFIWGLENVTFTCKEFCDSCWVIWPLVGASFSQRANKQLIVLNGPHLSICNTFKAKPTSLQLGNEKAWTVWRTFLQRITIASGCSPSLVSKTPKMVILSLRCLGQL